MTFTIVGLPKPHTLTAEREVAIAAFLVLVGDAIPGAPPLKLLDARGEILVPVLTASTRLAWFVGWTGIHLNKFLRAHKFEIATALQSIVPPIEQARRLSRALQSTEATHV
jgi:hypothetical protein